MIEPRTAATAEQTFTASQQASGSASCQTTVFRVLGMLSRLQKTADRGWHDGRRAASVQRAAVAQIHSKPQLWRFSGHPHGLQVCVRLLSGRTKRQAGAACAPPSKPPLLKARSRPPALLICTKIAQIHSNPASRWLRYHRASLTRRHGRRRSPAGPGAGWQPGRLQPLICTLWPPPGSADAGGQEPADEHQPAV